MCARCGAGITRKTPGGGWNTSIRNTQPLASIEKIESLSGTAGNAGIGIIYHQAGGRGGDGCHITYAGEINPRYEHSFGGTAYIKDGRSMGGSSRCIDGYTLCKASKRQCCREKNKKGGMHLLLNETVHGKTVVWWWILQEQYTKGIGKKGAFHRCGAIVD